MSLSASSREVTPEVSLGPIMPSHLHEELILLFRNRSSLAPELLQRACVEVPEYTEVRVDSADLTDLKPAAYRADLVLLLLKESERALGIIVEVQLSVDDDKRYTWPAYLANLRARIRCPVYLLVIAIERAVARWAGKIIELGGGSRIVPWVMGPDNIPAVTDLREAEEDVELAVLSAQAHGQDIDDQRATRIAAAAITAIAGIDSERSKMYFDIIWRSLSQAARRRVSEMSTVFEYQSDFARHYVAQGREEGKVEGRVQERVEIVLRLLTLRFGPLTEAIQTRVRDACSQGAEGLSDRVLTAETLEEALSAL